jgi:hypothetical protein
MKKQAEAARRWAQKMEKEIRYRIFVRDLERSKAAKK